MPLGKNLSNIIGDYFGEETVALNQNPTRTVDFDEKTTAANILISEIGPNPFQTRTNFEFEKIQSLAESIRENGLIHPIVVLRRKEPGDNLPYVLLAGERRLRACKMLNFTEILAVIKTEDTLSQSQQALLTAAENLQREDLSPLELAQTFAMLMKTQNLSEDGLATLLGYSAQHIKNYIRLLTLSSPVQQALLEKKLTEGQARHLVGLPESRQQEILEQILLKQLTVKEIVALLNKRPTPAPIVKNAVHNLPNEIINRAQKLAEHFPGAKLKCTGDEKKGKIVIQWGK
jgi:ParB family chromosome partitioning protein